MIGGKIRRPARATTLAGRFTVVGICLRTDRRHVDRDLHLIGDEHTTRLDRLIPRETVVAAIELRRAREADARLTPRIHAASLLLDLQLDLTRHTTNAQVTNDAVTIVASLLD